MSYEVSVGRPTTTYRLFKSEELRGKKRNTGSTQTCPRNNFATSLLIEMVMMITAVYFRARLSVGVFSLDRFLLLCKTGPRAESELGV